MQLKTSLSYILVFILFITVVFSCKKEERVYTVVYTIQEESNLPVSYSVQYKMADGTTRLEGPFSSKNYSSGQLEGFKPGSYAEIVLQTSKPEGNYRITILADNAILEQQQYNDPLGNITVSDYLPEQ
jgi:hypothetical protein